ncbi:mechanosensitive ion channel family protein [Mastigocoleus sp. MO_188.B34]|uniref:mechanosensitive ion channel family protein n=1 Tax=Mastigocoleus sp. MO_188.B34 TaxID=3036635 RepID=UPI002605A04A|nr:mechanosensitive ion channel family protein [Mastigocoleus sp. MO_188.B34]MDJ0694939.1 mechanosensitive ion channel family protein [Mastigocoleus sp. MO_188.B34]
MTIEWILPVAFILIGLIAGFIGEKIVYGKVKQIVIKKQIPGSDIIISSLHRMTFTWLFLAGLFAAIISYQLKPDVTEALRKFITIVFLFSITLVSARLTSGFVNLFIKRKEGISASLISNFAKTTVLVLGTLIILQTIGIEISAIVTTLGIGGLAVGLALQDTLANLFSGFYLILSKQVKTGDYIKLQDSQEGYITDITWRTTTIKSLSNNVVIIPNSQLGSAIFTNYHLPIKQLMVTMDVGVSYSSDLEKVEKITVEVATEVMREISPDITEREPFILFHTFNDFSIDYKVHIPVSEFLSQREAKHLFVKKLHKRYLQEGINIPFPIRDVNLQNN